MPAKSAPSQTQTTGTEPAAREQMNVVVIGHVDHGKSTVIGRLLADTNSLPEGKLQEVRDRCERNSRPFEYAFLLDALADEQAQGITIDSARCFFRSSLREYIVIDAPGHIEFLKNMISGAARAEAALLVIDAKEGIRENSRRHGYLLGMLGIGQVAVAVNKLDLVDYSRQVFDAITQEFSWFLSQIGIHPKGFIPVSARHGDNIVSPSARTAWYDGPSVLGMFDSFRKEAAAIAKPLRFPVQDVYKFTAEGDDRRIFAGRIETGSISVGNQVRFLPSGKSSSIASVEGFNSAATTRAIAGQSTGFTLDTQIYVQPGELMVRLDQPQPLIASQLKANIFWLGRHPMVMGRRYKLKLAGARGPVWLRSVSTVLDASNLTTETNRTQIERHDVAECVLETIKPVAFDLAEELPQTGRFVIIDDYEIAGGGIITGCITDWEDRTSRHVRQREQNWQRSSLTPGMRAGRYAQRSTLIVITGTEGCGKEAFAKSLELDLFNRGRFVYYLGISNSLVGLGSDVGDMGDRDEHLRRLGETAHLFTDAGVILVATVTDLDDYELEMLRVLNKPGDIIVVAVGQTQFSSAAPDLVLESAEDVADAIKCVRELLQAGNYLIEYHV